MTVTACSPAFTGPLIWSTVKFLTLKRGYHRSEGLLFHRRGGIRLWTYNWGRRRWRRGWSGRLRGRWWWAGRTWTAADGRGGRRPSVGKAPDHYLSGRRRWRWRTSSWCGAAEGNRRCEFWEQTFSSFSLWFRNSLRCWKKIEIKTRVQVKFIGIFGMGCVWRFRWDDSSLLNRIACVEKIWRNPLKLFFLFIFWVGVFNCFLGLLVVVVKENQKSNSLPRARVCGVQKSKNSQLFFWLN